ncbi:hypothetical protein QJS04_geneDACA003339 [Acorus gramineus]|uniref:Uncharacterized protein n=1 Tax=Acorus gramineus TaxID=55184 RepID=A0AAV9BMR0_ACOGR|nr:hypothetical protein QJS04_geneDACA003339 [Acorus gramineus]
MDHYISTSVLFDLEYWKYITVRHNLDVIHIEKNMCEILIALMLNTKGKTKDDVNARKDLKELRIKEQLWLKEEKWKEIQKPSRFWFRKAEKKMFLQTLRDLRVPTGFSSNWRNVFKEDSTDLKGMKSHDYHTLMQHLIPILIQHAFRDRNEICHILSSICLFFHVLCSRNVDIDKLNILERGMARSLCELERVCPPSAWPD